MRSIGDRRNQKQTSSKVWNISKFKKNKFMFPIKFMKNIFDQRNKYKLILFLHIPGKKWRKIGVLATKTQTLSNGLQSKHSMKIYLQKENKESDLSENNLFRFSRHTHLAHFLSSVTRGNGCHLALFIDVIYLHLAISVIHSLWQYDFS